MFHKELKSTTKHPKHPKHLLFMSNTLKSTTKHPKRPQRPDRASLTKEGEDEGALVCEFGAMKRGLSTMIPGESRRFWISSEVKEPKIGPWWLYPSEICFSHGLTAFYHQICEFQKFSMQQYIWYMISPVGDSQAVFPGLPAMVIPNWRYSVVQGRKTNSLCNSFRWDDAWNTLLRFKFTWDGGCSQTSHMLLLVVQNRTSRMAKIS